MKNLKDIPSYYIQVSNVDRRLLKGENIKNKKILNIGCGRKILTDMYFALNGADVTGIDNSKEALSIAQGKLKKANLDLKIKVEYEDARSLKFKNNTFDIVTSYSAIEHIINKKDRLKAIKEMVRVTKPNGIIVITVPNYLNLLATFISKRTYKRIDFSFQTS